MGGWKNGKKKAYRQQLWGEQGGLCHWCHRPMLLLEEYPTNGVLPDAAATIDHLYDRFHPKRRKPVAGEKRHVLAHFICNHERGRKTEARAKARRRAA
jgi:hypothetical protein